MTELLSRMLERATHDGRNRPALVDGEVAWTYGDLSDAVARTAAGLRGLGVGPGDVVLWQAPNRREVVTLFLACWHVGAVAAPVVEVYRESEVRRILDAVRPTLVATSPEHRGFAHGEMFDDLLRDLRLPAHRLALGGERRGWIGWDALGDSAPRDRAQLVSPDDPALLLFTSGTTSAPKAVVHTSRSLLAEAAQLTRAWRWTWDDASHVATPLAHVSGLFRAVVAPVWAGGSVVLRSRWDSEHVAADLVSSDLVAGSITFLGVPGIGSSGGVLGELLDAVEATGRRPAPLRMVVASAPVDQYERAEAMGLPPGQHYGMSELPTVTNVHPDDSFARRIASAGRIAFGVEVRTADERRVLPAGETGELQVRGPEQMARYLSAADDEAAWTPDRWLRTGDVGFVDGDGYVTITGRLKEIINRGGEKFSVLEIEEHLTTHPDVAEAAVLPAPDGRLGEVPAAFVVVRPGAVAPAADELARHLQAVGLARQKVPVEWRFVAGLPRTASGKVKKGELGALLAAVSAAKRGDTG